MCYVCVYVTLCVLLARTGDRILEWDNNGSLFSYRPRIPSYGLTIDPS